MPRNGSGSYTLPEAAFIPNTAISSSAMNSDLSDIADAMTDSLARDGQGGMTAVLPLANAGFTYLNDPNTGIRRTAADTQAIFCGAVDVISVGTAGATVTGTFGTSGALTVTAGGLTVTAGGATITAGGLTVTAGGATVTAGGLTLSTDTIIVPTGSASAPTYSFASDSNSGIYRIGADNIGVAVNGAKVLDISTSGLVVTGAVTGTSVTATNVASQADQEAGTSTTTFVSPGRQQFHQSAAKAWVLFNASVVVSASYNVSSVTDIGTGAWSPNMTTAFSSAGYVVQSTIGMSTSLAVGSNSSNVRTSSVCPLVAFNASNVLTDTTGFVDFLAFGDQ